MVACKTGTPAKGKCSPGGLTRQGAAIPQVSQCLHLKEDFEYGSGFASRKCKAVLSSRACSVCVMANKDLHALTVRDTNCQAWVWASVFSQGEVMH